MRKIDGCKCSLCTEPLNMGTLTDPPEAQVWRCRKCGTRNYVPGGNDCDCPVKGTGQGSACRNVRWPHLYYASDEWCNCACHR